MKYQIYQLILLCSILIACKNEPKNGAASADPTQDPKSGDALAANMMGDKLLAWNDPDSIKQRREQQIELARRNYLSKLNEPKGYLQYGRAYLANGQVENAIQIFGKGLEKFQEVPDLHVYNGEAHLIGRQFKAATEQFWKAGQKMEKASSASGISGMQDKDSIAGMTLQFKNYMLMGLAFQNNNDFSSADKMFEVCGDFSTNSDLWIRAYYWQYQCYHRSGRVQETANILSNISKTMQLLPISKSYLDAMLYYKSEISAAELIDLSKAPATHEEAEDWMVRAYALGVKYLLDKKDIDALKVFNAMMATGYWDLLPYLAAEAELARIKGVEQTEPEVIELNSKEKKRPVKF